MFLHVSVILSTEGVRLSACWDIPQEQAPPPGAGTPLEQAPLSKHPPGADTPQSRHPPPPGADTSPPGAGTAHSSACWEIQPTSGRYISYWNAFLLMMSSNDTTMTSSLLFLIC